MRLFFGCFFLHPNKFLPTSFLKKTVLPLLKMTSRLFFLEYLRNIFFKTQFLISRFTNLKKKSILERILRNCFLSFGFSIPEIFFTYRTPIPETFFVYETPIPESHKTVKG